MHARSLDRIALLALAAVSALAGATLTTAAVQRQAAPRPALHRPALKPPPPVRAPLPVAAAPAPAPLAYSYDWLRANGQPDLGVGSQAGILVDLDARRVLWDEGSGQRRAPASLTKMMTTMVALDHAPLLQPLAVPATALASPEETSMGLQAGQTFTLRELLYGIYLVSANDAAETMAQDIMPRDQFIAAMNQKAAALRLANTHFENPTGLDGPGQYSSAYDLAVMTGLLQLDYPAPTAIAAVPQVALYATDGHPEVDMLTLDKLLLWPYPWAVWGKTGYTDAAGGCVAAVASRNGHTLVAIVLGSDVQFTDATKLFDYGFGAVGA